MIAWNRLVEKRSENVAAWQRQAKEGDALERYRTRLMLAVTADGPLETEVPELTRMFLEEIVVHTPTEMTWGSWTEAGLVYAFDGELSGSPIFFLLI